MDRAYANCSEQPGNIYNGAFALEPATPFPPYESRAGLLGIDELEGQFGMLFVAARTDIWFVVRRCIGWTLSFRITMGSITQGLGFLVFSGVEGTYIVGLRALGGAGHTVGWINGCGGSGAWG